MKSYTMDTLAEALGVSVINGEGSTVISGGVSTDTRVIPDGSLFVALKGERFDAHEFLKEAAKKGASGLLVQDASDLPVGVPALLVEDTLTGLQKLAAWYRGQLEIKVIAITGSNGKTSTKDLTKAVLGQTFTVRATRGNLNNHIGLPLSVLEATEEDQVCVWEMGMNHPGEIAPLCEIARPDISIITNIGTAHIEYMRTQDAIAEEKAAVAEALTEKGTLVVPADCAYNDYFATRTSAKIMPVGHEAGELQAKSVEMTPSGSEFVISNDAGSEIPVQLPVTGRHMVSNAMLAAGVGHLLGLSMDQIAKGLESLELSGGRLRRFESRGVVVFDDTYNANPDSVKAAIEALTETQSEGDRYVVLGQMAELGDHAAEGHLSVGQLAAQKGLKVVSVGEGAKGIYEGAIAVDRNGAQHFDEKGEAAEWLLAKTSPGDMLLFKGSRSAAMEQVMKAAFPPEEG